jgi:hypothetical protein
MSDKDQKKLIWLLLSTLFIKALWTLHPDALLPPNEIPVYKMFKYSDILISKPTYFYFICAHTIMLIYIFVWGELLPRYRKLFVIWFVIQALQFVEYFFNYNEAQLWYFIGRYKLDVDLTLAKMTVLPATFLLYDYIWRRK